MKNIRNIPLRNLLISGTILLAGTLIALFLFSLRLRRENVFMLYILVILFTILLTNKYIWGLLSSLASVILLNYFFIEQRFSLILSNYNYLASLSIFLIVSLIIIFLAARIQRQVNDLNQMQRLYQILNEAGTGMLNISGIREQARYCLDYLEKIHPGEYGILLKTREKETLTSFPDPLTGYCRELDPAIDWCLSHSCSCDCRSEQFGELPYMLFPVTSKGFTYGVLTIKSSGRPDEDFPVIEAISTMISLAIDREVSNTLKQESVLAAEQEKLRNSLLHSISHDLRTPLAGITGSASFLLESFDRIDRQSRETLLQDITDNAGFLTQMVDNLLNLTRVQEGRLKLHYVREVVDDIFSEVVRRRQSFLKGRRLETVSSDNCLSAPMDGPLIIQVLVNLVDNSIRHTSVDGCITLMAEKAEFPGTCAPAVRFMVTDNGTGIDPAIINHMFESFVTSGHLKGADKGRGMGLGLSISSEIVKAHQGTIGSYNLPGAGAAVYFLLPLYREEKEYE